MDSLKSILEYELLGIAVEIYLLAFLSIVAGFVVRRLVQAGLDRLYRAAEVSTMRYDEIVVDALRRPLEWAAVLAGIWGAAAILPLPGADDVVNIDRFVHAAMRSFSIGLLIWFGVRLSDGLFRHWERLAAQTESRLDDQIVPIVRSSTKVFLVIIGSILVLQNLGYSVTSLIAGLGIGGAALALASKDTLSNLFGSIVVFLDRPFQIGDWIEMNGMEGVVEEVGLRTTRLRTFANSLITLPNSLFTTSAINNWSRMAKRRIRMTIGLTYGTSADQMRQAIQAIKDIILADERFHHDSFVVAFDAFGPSSLDILINCFTRSTSGPDYIAAKQDFLLAIMDAMHAIGVSFAFPTQTLHVESLPAHVGGFAKAG